MELLQIREVQAHRASVENNVGLRRHLQTAVLGKCNPSSVPILDLPAHAHPAIVAWRWGKFALITDSRS